MNLTPQTFLTSDTHFGHMQLVAWKLRPANFNEIIIRNWNNTVKKDDVIVVLGDLTITGKNESYRYLSRLQGKKYLVRGNHDNRSSGWYKDLGFDVIPAMFYKHENCNILFTHEPIMQLPINWFNVHGHLHGNTHREHPEAKQHLDIGTDCFNFTPVRLSEVLKIITKGTNEQKP